MIKRVAKILVVLILTIFGLFYCGKPLAVIQAESFGKAFHSAISDSDLLSWVTLFDHSLPTDESNRFYIPQSKWPIQIQKLLEHNKFAQAFVCFDADNKPNGIIFLDGISGIVIPLRNSLPDPFYFSLHMISDTCPYYSFCRYK